MQDGDCNSGSEENIDRRIARSLLFLTLVSFGASPAHAVSPQDVDAIMLRAMEAEARAVSDQYSTKPVRVKLGRHRYTIPANYFGPKGRLTPDTFDAGEAGYFGFRLFLPEYGGYTKENWRDKFDERLITVLSVELVDKNRRGHFPDGRLAPPNPAGYGKPRAMFRNRRLLLEATPSLHYYGLEGYRSKHGRYDVTWVGRRSNGEFFFFTCHLAPGDPPQPGTFPFCDVRYYSEKEDLQISYRYANSNFSKWRDIDDAIWGKLHLWERQAK